MISKIFQILSALCIAVFLGGSQLNAQEEPRNSLSLGLATGPAMVAYPGYNTAVLGLDFSYEYRLLPFLSVQTSLCPRYFFPLSLTKYPTGSGNLAQSVVTHKQKHFTFRLAPCFYLRRKHFSLFAGVSWAVGNYTMYTSWENTYDDYPSEGESFTKTSNSEDIHTIYGFSPFLGTSLAVGGPQSNDEIAISLSFNQHTSGVPVAGFHPNLHFAGYKSFEIKTSYRFNF